MSKFLASAAALALVAAAVSAPASAAQIEPQACTVNITHTFGQTIVLNYTRDFVVGLDSPYSEDFSTATRFRFFDAFLEDSNGTPVVTIVLDSDISVFNSIFMNAELQVKDQTKGESTKGQNGFFGSAPGTGNNVTRWDLTCKRAR